MTLASILGIEVLGSPVALMTKSIPFPRRLLPCPLEDEAPLPPLYSRRSQELLLRWFSDFPSVMLYHLRFSRFLLLQSWAKWPNLPQFRHTTLPSQFTPSSAISCTCHIAGFLVVWIFNVVEVVLGVVFGILGLISAGVTFSFKLLALTSSVSLGLPRISFFSPLPLSNISFLSSLHVFTLPGKSCIDP